MTVRNLDAALHPRSVAVIGAAADPILRNIRAGGFEGPVWPVDPERASAEGLPTVPRIDDLPEAPDVAILALAPEALPAAIAALGARGCRLAVVTGRGPEPGPLRQAMLDAARPHLLRIVGPGSFGLVVPGARLNASLVHGPAAPGRLGLLAQSGSVAAATVDWAAERGVGFSRVVALGAMADADAGDFLDLLATDGATRAILLQLETIPAPRKFLSAARAAARLKPVIALKAGRTPAAAAAALTHTGALSGADAVVAAALRRAGILRVEGLAEMFAAAETVGRFKPMTRVRLAIVTNGGGPGVLAADGLAKTDGSLAVLGPETVAGLPADAAGTNPLDLRADAPPARYAAALDALAADAGIDALLVLHAPNVLADPLEVAGAVARTGEGRPDRRQAGLRLLDGRRHRPRGAPGAARRRGRLLRHPRRRRGRRRPPDRVGPRPGGAASGARTAAPRPTPLPRPGRAPAPRPCSGAPPAPAAAP